MAKKKPGRRPANQLTHCFGCGEKLLPDPQDWLDLREKFHLTQRQIADMLGVKASHVAYLENAKRFPSAALILRKRALEEKLAKAEIKRAQKTLAAAQKPSRSRPASKQKAA